MMKLVLWLGLVLVVGCTRPNPEYCGADSECMDPKTPFCDVNGEYAESDHTAHTCSAIPVGCPAERCGCTPTMARCDGDDLFTCNADGHSETMETCPLGCLASEARCYTFTPSNGLGPALVAAANEQDITLPAGAKINTSTGAVTTSTGDPIAINSVVVTQGTTSIRAFLARSWTLQNVTITGGSSFAAVSPGAITVTGHVDASAIGTSPGPGAQEYPATCAGARSAERSCNTGTCAPGAGGGGNASVGGAGGSLNAVGAPAGAPQTQFTPLVGGCRGGALLLMTGPISKDGGGGGGAVQLTSGSEIVFMDHGVLDVGGGGGSGTGAGGGAGGNVVLEAPEIRLDGSTVGIAANGGAGGACDAVGADGMPNTTIAVAAVCSPYSGGNGGTGNSAPTSGEICTGFCFDGRFGGGGGAAGRVQFVTGDGNYVAVSSPFVSAAITKIQMAKQ